MGFQTTGVASHYFAVDAAKVTPLPDDLTYDEGAMIEPLAVGGTRHTAGRGRVREEDSCAGGGADWYPCGTGAKGMGADAVMVN